MNRAAPDFTAHRHPVLAVACPDCRAPAGSWCRRPSGHRAADFHGGRKAQADAAFIEQHGEDAWIERLGDGWRVHQRGRAAAIACSDQAARQMELPV